MHLNKWTKKGMSFNDREEYDESIKCFVKALEEDPIDLNALVGKGVALINSQRFAEAVDPLGKATLFYPTNIQAWDYKGIALGKLGKIEEAKACYKKALSLDPMDSFARVHMWNL